MPITHRPRPHRQQAGRYPRLPNRHRLRSRKLPRQRRPQILAKPKSPEPAERMRKSPPRQSRSPNRRRPRRQRPPVNKFPPFHNAPPNNAILHPNGRPATTSGYPPLPLFPRSRLPLPLSPPPALSPTVLKLMPGVRSRSQRSAMFSYSSLPSNPYAFLINRSGFFHADKSTLYLSSG